MSAKIESSAVRYDLDHQNVNSGANRRLPVTKIIKVVAGGTVVLIGMLLLSLIVYRASAGGSEFLTTSSPSGTYRVSLSGRKGRPPLGFTNEVRFEVFKNGELFVGKKYLHSADSFDLSFEAGYPNHAWLRENVLHFYRDEYLKKERLDTIMVSNKTGEKIRYLRLQCLDKFLLLDVEPFSSMKLAASPPRGDIKWVGAEGEFSHGQKIELTGVNFKTRKEVGEAFTYYLSITDRGLVVESPQLEKYDPE